MSLALVLVLSGVAVLLLLPAVLLALFLRLISAPVRGAARAHSPRSRLLDPQPFLTAVPGSSSGGRKVS
jgi:hypothetical protein